MTDHRNTSRIVIAVSSAVVACCAVAVTVKVLSTGPVLVEQPRVLDQQSLERQVTEQVPGGEVKALACPTAVQVEVGRSFECRYWGETNPGTAKVEITDDQGTLSISTD